jgi:hypothetical protein
MGFHRSIEICENHVIKKARNRYSAYCNQLEAERSGSSKYLALVLDYSPDFSMLKMEKVEIPSIIKRLKYSKFLKSELKGIGDIHWYNIGDKNGTPMLYDYGETFIIWRLLFKKIMLVFKTKEIGS